MLRLKWKPLKVFCLLILTTVGACSNMRHVEWTEDVRLSNGRTIVAKRAEECRHITDPGAGFREGWLLEQSTVTADLPEAVKRSISWQGLLQPVVLDVQQDGTVYLVGVPASGRAAREWKLPRHEFYAVLRLGRDDWERISVDQLPYLGTAQSFC